MCEGLNLGNAMFYVTEVKIFRYAGDGVIGQLFIMDEYFIEKVWRLDCSI